MRKLVMDRSLVMNGSFVMNGSCVVRSLLVKSLVVHCSLVVDWGSVMRSLVVHRCSVVDGSLVMNWSLVMDGSGRVVHRCFMVRSLVMRNWLFEVFQVRDLVMSWRGMVDWSFVVSGYSVVRGFVMRPCSMVRDGVSHVVGLISVMNDCWLVPQLLVVGVFDMMHWSMCLLHVMRGVSPLNVVRLGSSMVHWCLVVDCSGMVQHWSF